MEEGREGKGKGGAREGKGWDGLGWDGMGKKGRGAVLPLWSAFAEKVRILTFCPKLVRKRSVFTQ